MHPALAALPALLCSLWLMAISAAPRNLLILQAAVATIALLATLIAIRLQQPTYRTPPHPLLLLALAAAVFVPLVSATAAAPHRWLSLGSFRLYVAPVVIPLFLLLWHRTLAHPGEGTPWVAHFSAALLAAALFTQPDAAQLTAFAVAAAPVLWHARLDRRWQLAVIAGALVAAAVCWRLPDPLVPVPYVEGVFHVAAQTSLALLAAAIVSAALPVAVLAGMAHRQRSPGLLAVALYLGVLFLLAPTQSTPVPLLGFGAGPILGYFLLASQAWRRSARPV